MTCNTLEPLITITKATRGRGYDVTRHRRDCGMAGRSLSTPSAGGSTMNQTEFLQRGVEGQQGPYEQVPKNHACMKRRTAHLIRDEGAIL